MTSIAFYKYVLHSNQNRYTAISSDILKIVRTSYAFELFTTITEEDKIMFINAAAGFHLN